MISRIYYSVFVLLVVFSCTSNADYMIDDLSGVERLFDGIGGLSGGGATSKLLANYPPDVLSQILDYLFLPNFGAALQILKVEIGGDAQSTDGTESSHMHESWDEDYTRGYEWWLMVEAKKRNPSIKLYGLPWAFPGWVGNGTNDPYKYPQITATYVVKWIVAAKKYYNLTIDYIGVWNERDYNIAYVLALDAMLTSSGFSNVKIVAADSGWGISGDILKNASFAYAVDYIGCHYPGTTSTADALKTNKPLWASEDYSTFNDDVGAGCWARILNQNYVNGYMTSTISWNLIASYYEALPFARDGLMTAEEPWSGHYVVSNPIWITAHTTQFVEVGWNYLPHSHGVGHLDGGGSYVALTSPDRHQLTIVIETMSHDHSVCIRPDLPPYKVVAQQATFVLGGNFSKLAAVSVWMTQLKFDGTEPSVFVKQASITPIAGSFTITLDPDQIYTITSMTTGAKGSYGVPPPSRPFPLPYKDDFEGYPLNSEAYNFAPQGGVWEIRQSNNVAHGKVNRQVVLNDPIYWCNTGSRTQNVGGSHNWDNLFITIDVFVPSLNGSAGAYVAARVDRGGCDAAAAKGVFFFVFPDSNTFVVSTSLRAGGADVLLNQTLSSPLKSDMWYKLTLITKGSAAYGLIDDTTFLFQVNIPDTIKMGFVAYGTSSYGYADFDNLSIDSSGPSIDWSGPNIDSSGPSIDSSGPSIVSSGPNIDSSGPSIDSSGPIVSAVSDSKLRWQRPSSGRRDKAIGHNKL